MSEQEINEIKKRLDQLTECIARVQMDVSALKESTSFLKQAYFLVFATCLGTLVAILFKK